jgi:hypothetical protein
MAMRGYLFREAAALRSVGVNYAKRSKHAKANNALE